MWQAIASSRPPPKANPLIAAITGFAEFPIAEAKAARDALGLTKGSVLKVEMDGSRIVLSKHVDDAISRVRGKFALDVPAGSGKG